MAQEGPSVVKTLTLNTYNRKQTWHTFVRSQFLDGEYIAITTAIDDHKSDYRDHQNRSILAKNARRNATDLAATFDAGSDARACAGGTFVEAGAERHRVDDAHTAFLSFNLTMVDPDSRTRGAAVNEPFQVRLSTRAGADGARLIVRNPDRTIRSFEPETAELRTDANGRLNVELLSSRQVGAAEVQLWGNLFTQLSNGVKDVSLQRATQAANAALNPLPADPLAASTTAFAQAYAEAVTEGHELSDAEQATFAARAETAANAARDAVPAGADAATTLTARQQAYYAAYVAAFDNEANALRDWSELTRAAVAPNPAVVPPVLAAAATRRVVTFALPEGRRLFGIKDRFWFADYTFNNDRGWNFTPPALERVGNFPNVASSVLRCQFFLRFRKNTTAAIDQRYFVDTRTTQDVASLDADLRNGVDDAEWQHVQPCGDENNPLEASAPDPRNGNARRRLWYRVGEHRLRFSIAQLLQTETAPAPSIPPPPRDPNNGSFDPLAVSFCDQSGNYLQIQANGDPQVNPTTGAPIYGPNRPARTPAFIPISTDANGVATFYLRASFWSHRMNEIRLNVEDTTTR